MPDCEQCGTTFADDEGVVVALNKPRYEGQYGSGSDPVDVTLCPKCARSYLGLFRFWFVTFIIAVAMIAVLKLLLDWLD
jgi:hypothetical protein